MDDLISVQPGTERQVLHDIRSLLRDHILPRMTDLEVEVLYLRRVCWPVCQALREKSQLDGIKSKRYFLNNSTSDMDEVKHLLNEKQKITQKLFNLGLGSHPGDLVIQEFYKLFPTSASASTDAVSDFRPV